MNYSNKSKMTINQLDNIAFVFRKAILNAKRNRQFSCRDRMSNFPWGCCDDSCDLLGYYLLKEYDIHTEQGNGVYRDTNAENTTNHVWLITDQHIFIDITIDQFLCQFPSGIYVGEDIPFYQNLENTTIYNNFDITQSERLWSDYQIINKYIHR